MAKPVAEFGGMVPESKAWSWSVHYSAPPAPSPAHTHPCMQTHTHTHKKTTKKTSDCGQNFLLWISHKMQGEIDQK